MKNIKRFFASAQDVWSKMNPTIRCSIGVISCLSLAGASFIATRADAGEQGIDTVIRNVDISHCEAFIDRAALVLGNGQRMTMRFYIKLLPERLDGNVKYVGFHAYKTDSDGVCKGPSTMSNPWCQNVGIWADYKSRPFVYESNDYHDIRIDMSDIDGDFFEYEGVFFVQTDVGTRYWLHSSKNTSNFLLDEKMVDSMVENNSAFTIDSFDLSKVPQAWSLPMGLNASECR